MRTSIGIGLAFYALKYLTFNANRFAPSPYSWVLLLLLSYSSSAFASDPVVRFDANRLVAAQVIPTPDGAIPVGAKLVEAVFPVSAVLVRGDERDVSYYIFRIESQNWNPQVVGYLPRVEAIAEYAGNVAVDRKTQTDANIVFKGTSGPSWGFNANLDAKYNYQDVATEKYERLPPQQTVLVSGTSDRGGGAFFKIIPSPQRTPDGGREFVLRMLVPENWRGGMMQVTCFAFAKAEAPWGSEQYPCSQAGFLVGLYDGRDWNARSQMENYLNSIEQLHQAKQNNEERLQRASYNNPLESLGVALQVKKPDIPRDWTSDLLLYGDRGNFKQYYYRLPPEVRAAADNYLAERARTTELTGMTSLSR